jgi:hypothetical protein
MIVLRGRAGALRTGEREAPASLEARESGEEK